MATEFIPGKMEVNIRGIFLTGRRVGKESIRMLMALYLMGCGAMENVMGREHLRFRDLMICYIGNGRMICLCRRNEMLSLYYLLYFILKDKSLRSYFLSLRNLAAIVIIRPTSPTSLLDLQTDPTKLFIAFWAFHMLASRAMINNLVAGWIGTCSQMREVIGLDFSLGYELERFGPFGFGEDIFQLCAVGIPADVESITYPLFRAIVAVISVVAFWAYNSIGF